jgi:Domain of unknown function (DUF1905)
MVELRRYASPCLSWRASSGSIRPMDMREIMMIIGGDDPVVEAITATGPVWLWRAEPPAKGSWHFLTIAGAPANAIRTAAGGRSGGWGSVRVTATIGETSWQTSLFPNKELGGYMLPLKADVRKREGVHEGDEISVTLSLD